MPLTKDRNTGFKDVEIISLAVAAAVKCFAGGIAVLKAGYCKPGVTEVGAVYVGRFEETVDNSSGANGDVSVQVRRGKLFHFKNSAGDAIAQADVGATCYIEDDETVSKTDGASSQSEAGQIYAVDNGGVWVL